MTVATLSDTIRATTQNTHVKPSTIHAMLANGVPEHDIIAWAKLGDLTYAEHLDNINFPITVAQQFPPHKNLLRALKHSVNTAINEGMSIPDLPLWHQGGAYRLSPPFIDRRIWGPWRAVAIHHTGFRNAALACAAGFQPDETITMFVTGNWDPSTVEMMAALRANR